MRLLDAQIRFAPLPGAGDRADLYVEKGRLLEDRLGRDDDALAAYQSAIEISPGHAAGLWAQLLLAARTGQIGEIEAALGGLFGGVVEPEVRAHLAVELARVQRGPVFEKLDPERCRQAADTLFRALSSGASPWPMLAELDRLSLLAGKADLRARVLDAYDSRLSREPPHAAEELAAAAALYREKARGLLRRGAREAALAVLERALAVAPGHPLVIADYIDMADEIGRPDAIGALVARLETSSAGPTVDRALLRRAEVASRGGAFGEAIEALDRISADSRFAPLGTWTRACVLSRLGDTDGLARLFQEEAERHLAPPAPGAGAQREAAHLLVRAATLRFSLAEVEAGESLCRRALETARTGGALEEALEAEDGLLEALARRESWSELRERLESRLAVAQGEAERSALRGSLVLLLRDVLDDPEAALALARQRGADDPLVEELRIAELAARAAATHDADTDTAAALRNEAAEALLRAAATVEGAAASAALRVAAAPLFAGAGRQDEAGRALAAAVTADPAGPATAATEQEAAGAARLALLERELAAAGTRFDAAPEVPRALRFRLALAASEQDRSEDALAALAPLRGQGDAPAITWSIELARAHGDLAGEAALLREALGEELVGPGPPGPDELAFERAMALGAALETTGDFDGAELAFAAARDRAPEGRAALPAVALVRLAARSRDGARLVEETRRLASVVSAPEAGALLEEAERLAIATGVPTSGALPATNATEVIRGLWEALAAGDVRRRIDALERLAQVTGPDAPGPLWGLVGVERALRGEIAAAISALLQAEAAGGFPGLEVAASDLFAAPVPSALQDLRHAHGERLLCLEGSPARLGEAVLFDEALDAESTGRLRAAATTYARILVDRPGSIEAAEGLRRLAEADGDPVRRAKALAQLGTLLRSPRQAAARFAEAALLLEDADHEEPAAALYVRVLERVPTDDEAYHRLYRILDRRSDVAGLEALVSFRLRHTIEPLGKVVLLQERARLRAERLGRPDEAILDHRRALALDERNVDSRRALAGAARAARRFDLAVAHLEAAGAVARPDEALSIRLEIVAIVEEGGRADAADALLRALIEAYAEETEPRERMIALSLRRGDFDRAFEQLAALAALAESPADKAAILRRVGELKRDRVGSVSEAVEAFRAALDVDPLSEAAADLATLVPARFTLSRSDEAAVDRMVDDLRREVGENPADVVRLQRLRDLALVRGAKGLAAVATQLLGALGADGGERPRVRDLARPLPAIRLTSLGVAAGDGIHLIGEVASIVARAMAELEPLDVVSLGIGRQTRVSPGSDARLKWVEAAGLALGVSEITLHVHGDDMNVGAYDVPEPILVLGRGAIGGDAGSRFRVGRALELLRRRATGLDRRPLADYEALWRAVVHLSGVRNGSDGAEVKALAKALARQLGRKELKALEGYRRRFETEPFDVALWHQQALRAADRVGLLASGDLGQTLRAIGGPSPSAASLRQPRAAEIIAFALGDSYTALRVEAGVREG